MENEFQNKTILVTGGTGSIGAELVRQLLKYKPKQIRVLSRNETRQYHLLEALRYPKNLRMLIGDIRDRERLQLAFKNVDIVFHAAALKHVPFCEYNPSEAMKTNIIGSHNIIDAALHSGVEKIIAISTDKVANPLNVLGVSKLMMEKLFINSHFFLGNKMKLACVRFGNVAWADGSVLPMWAKQVEAKGAINVTNKDATRFLMSIKQAVSLTLKAAQLCLGGEIFILKMPSIRLGDLADIFIRKYYSGKKMEPHGQARGVVSHGQAGWFARGAESSPRRPIRPRLKQESSGAVIKIKYIGDRAGDKLHEALLGANDSNKETWVNNEMLILVPTADIHNLVSEPRFYEGFKRVASGLTFSSEDHLDIKKIERIV